MKLEKLKPQNTKKKFIIGLASIAILSAGALTLTHAKYKTSESIEIANGTINYELADTNLIGVYVQNGEDYTKSDTIPEGYVLNEEESYCKVNNEVDTNISITYDTDSKTLSITPMTTKGTKCYLYFDAATTKEVDTVLGKIDVNLDSPDFSKTAQASCSSTSTCEETNGIYEGEDDNGTTYYWRGAVDNNWVYFGGFYWRIIRINGNRTVRLIYNGTSTATTGTGTMASINQEFNSLRGQSEYVGLKYTESSQHGTVTPSSILTALNNWYSSSNLDDYASYIDSDVGFCSDRNMASGSSWSSEPSNTIRYAAWGRLRRNQSPSFKCSNSSDMLRIPVGLITADEVAFAGGVYNITNQSYYLYNGYIYWTMSPCDYSNQWANVFRVDSDGYLYGYGVAYEDGMRPAINLKATTQFTGSGTTSDPYKVVS